MVYKLNKIILPGGAGLVGQNLVIQLKNRGYQNIVVLDKHRANRGGIETDSSRYYC